MNIFILDTDPAMAARSMCDKHIPKMVLESAQLLCLVHHLIGKPGQDVPYRLTHRNHPCSIWSRTAKENYSWLADHARVLVDEFTLRFNKEHASSRVLDWCKNSASNLSFDSCKMTSFAQAMPEYYKNENPVQAYRSYYLGEKRKFATWVRGRSCPYWWME